MGVRINGLSPVNRLWAKFATKMIQLWLRTLSLEVDPESEELLRRYRSRAKICVLWHNRLMVAPLIYQRYFQDQTMYGLVSPSRDGAWLTALLENLGIRAVRGSSQHRGRGALLEMRNVLHRGHSVTITPDGPRGPRYVAKPGVAVLAKESHVPILLGGISIPKCWRLKSWDRFYLPKPFSKIYFHIEIIDLEEYGDRSSDDLQIYLQKVLYNLNSKHRSL
ncbi:MAG: lysophospholipid acyltransferase family protein [Verrucomicrobiota bacterium]|nr:MAG: lysophospholipid acyltransferase family protein [Verrucomicrobiota bacterium]